MINLIKNSLDSLRHLDIQDKAIHIKLYKTDSSIMIEVKDNGHIEKEIADKIFEPYFSTKKGSLGLGLYMSRMIVEKHLKGKININYDEKSVKFYIILPLDIT